MFFIAGIAIGEGGGLPAPFPHATPMLFIHKILINMYSNNTLHNAQKTNKNALEKEHTFSRRSKNKKQNGEKRILCKFAFSKKTF